MSGYSGYSNNHLPRGTPVQAYKNAHALANQNQSQNHAVQADAYQTQRQQSYPVSQYHHTHSQQASYSSPINSTNNRFHHFQHTPTGPRALTGKSYQQRSSPIHHNQSLNQSSFETTQTTEKNWLQDAYLSGSQPLMPSQSTHYDPGYTNAYSQHQQFSQESYQDPTWDMAYQGQQHDQYSREYQQPYQPPQQNFEQQQQQQSGYYSANASPWNNNFVPQSSSPGYNHRSVPPPPTIPLKKMAMKLSAPLDTIDPDEPTSVKPPAPLPLESYIIGGDGTTDLRNIWVREVKNEVEARKLHNMSMTMQFAFNYLKSKKEKLYMIAENVDSQPDQTVMKKWGFKPLMKFHDVYVKEPLKIYCPFPKNTEVSQYIEKRGSWDFLFDKFGKYEASVEQNNLVITGDSTFIRGFSMRMDTKVKMGKRYYEDLNSEYHSKFPFVDDEFVMAPSPRDVDESKKDDDRETISISSDGDDEDYDNKDTKIETPRKKKRPPTRNHSEDGDDVINQVHQTNDQSTSELLKRLHEETSEPSPKKSRKTKSSSKKRGKKEKAQVEDSDVEAAPSPMPPSHEIIEDSTVYEIDDTSDDDDEVEQLEEFDGLLEPVKRIELPQLTTTDDIPSDYLFLEYKLTRSRAKTFDVTAMGGDIMQRLCSEHTSFEKIAYNIAKDRVIFCLRLSNKDEVQKALALLHSMKYKKEVLIASLAEREIGEEFFNGNPELSIVKVDG